MKITKENLKKYVERLIDETNKAKELVDQLENGGATEMTIGVMTGQYIGLLRASGMLGELLMEDDEDEH